MVSLIVLFCISQNDIAVSFFRFCILKHIFTYISFIPEVLAVSQCHGGQNTPSPSGGAVTGMACYQRDWGDIFFYCYLFIDFVKIIMIQMIMILLGITLSILHYAIAITALSGRTGNPFRECLLFGHYDMLCLLL